MQTIYAIAPKGSELTGDALATAATRGAALGAQPHNGVDATALGTSVYPSVVVISTVPGSVPVVIADDSGQATLSEVQAAQSAATAAETSQASGITTITASLQAAVASLAPGLAQATTDEATCAASTDALAPILGRVVTDLATVAKAVAGLLALDEIIEASEVPKS